MKRSTFLNSSGTRNQRNLDPNPDPSWKYGIVLSSSTGVHLVDPYTFEEIWEYTLSNCSVIALCGDRVIVQGGSLDSYAIDMQGNLIETVDYEEEAFLFVDKDPSNLRTCWGTDNHVYVFDKNLNTLKHFEDWVDTVTYEPRIAKFDGNDVYLLASVASTGAQHVFKYLDGYTSEDWDLSIFAGIIMDFVVYEKGGSGYALGIEGSVPQTSFSFKKVLPTGSIDWTAAIDMVSMELPFEFKKAGTDFYIFGGDLMSSASGFIHKVSSIGGTTWSNTSFTDTIHEGIIDPSDNLLIYTPAAGQTIVKITSDNSGNEWSNTYSDGNIMEMFQDPTDPTKIIARTSTGYLKRINMSNGATVKTSTDTWTNSNMLADPGPVKFTCVGKYLDQLSDISGISVHE